MMTLQFKTCMIALTTPRHERIPSRKVVLPGSAGILPAWTTAGLRPVAGWKPALPGTSRGNFHGKGGNRDIAENSDLDRRTEAPTTQEAMTS